MKTRLVMAATTIAALTCAATAQAETLLFSYSEPGLNFSFEQSSNPTPIAYQDDNYTQTPVTDWTGSVGPYTSIVWYSTDQSGMFDTPDSVYDIVGAQVYSGSESNPTFTPGVYTASDMNRDYLGGTLTITAVPEPASWALMLIGLGALGAALRTSRRAPAAA
jgi:PEP-CTERM motif